MIKLDEFILPEGFDITDHAINMFLIRIVNMDINRNNFELGKVILCNQLSDRTLPVHRRENDIYMFVYKNGLFYYHAELNKIITAVGQGSSRERFLWRYILPLDAKYPRVSSELKHHLKAKGFVPEYIKNNIIAGSALRTKVAYDIDRNKVIVVQGKVRSVRSQI
jgi:hypothetical protein